MVNEIVQVKSLIVPFCGGDIIIIVVQELYSAHALSFIYSTLYSQKSHALFLLLPQVLCG